jgi:hypothetical protein
MRLFLVVYYSIITYASALSLKSAAGKHLMSKARRLGNNNNNNKNNYDWSWMSDYSIQFDSCHTTLNFRAQGNSGDADAAPTESERLVLFKLCPTKNNCSNNCKGGAEYLVELKEFVEAYMNSQKSQKEYNCAKVKNKCSCENDDSINDDNVCLSKCYANAGLNYCENNEEQEFEVDRYLECRNPQGNNNKNNNNNGDDSTQIYIGAYCSSNGKHIYLGAFSDRQCSIPTDASVYEAQTGIGLPYTTTSMVGTDCITCREPSAYDDDYNADANDEDTIREICTNVYQRSAKCETNLDISTKVTGGCNYIHQILPRTERAISSSSSSLSRRSASVGWAWTFAMTTLIASAAAIFFYRQTRRKTGVNLSSQGDGVMS